MNPQPTTPTTCPYCGTGCGVLATPQADGSVKIAGDPAHPANFGRLCSKGAALGETLSLDDRLLYPEVRGQRVEWDAALQQVADGFRRIIEQHGPDAVAFYVSGQLLTEDYYVANKLMKGFLGSANIDTNSRLCMASSVAGHKRAFGSDSVPGCYEDLELADLIVITGSNLAWCHPVLFQRIAAAKRQRPEMKVVVIDPRRTATCDIADLHLPLQSGSDVWLFNGLLDFLRRNDHLDYEFLEAHTEGFSETLRTARESAGSVPVVARACGLEESTVAEFYRLFARTEKTVTIYSQGVNQSSAGTDKVNSILNCHLATGRIGQPGLGPFSVTGQPNAMGGREVGALANQLVAHMDFTPDALDRVGAFWQAQRLAQSPGLKAVDLFQAIGEGRVKAVWIMATNPAMSLPAADQVRRALARCELVVVSDVVRHTDTTAFAHILLPALAWGEKDGTATNSERRLSRQRAFLPTPGAAKPDWWIVSQVAQRLGFRTQFNYSGPADILREYATLSGHQNNGERAFDISPLQRLSDADYAALQPVQWPLAHPGQGQARLFGNGQFYTPNRKARLVPVMPNPPQNAVSRLYPMVLNTGRVRDQWHSMTRTGKTARLLNHIGEPYLSIHPTDARRAKIADGSLVRLDSLLGGLILRAQITDSQPLGNVFVPMHWSYQLCSHGSVGRLISPDTDPSSGQPEFKHTPVRMEPYQPVWQGFVLTRTELDSKLLVDVDFFTKTREGHCWRYELAGEQPLAWGSWARRVCGEGEWLEYADPASGRYRSAKIVEGRLHSCLFIGPDVHLPSRSGVQNLFEQDSLDSQERLGLLAGKPRGRRPDAGRVVCACFNVGYNTLVEAIREQKLTSVDAIGAALKAGTNCGSCVPELKQLLKT